MQNVSIHTASVHAGEPTPRLSNAVVLPVFQSATYLYEGETDYHDIGYMRLNNSPNHAALHAKIAALESAEAALVAASGMAIISATLLSLLDADDHVIALDCLYGGTHTLLTGDLPRFRIAHDFVPGDDPDAWRAALTPRTKIFYVETLTNPLLQVPDLQRVVEFAREHGLVTVIDNTFASPVLFRPCELGFDLVIESCTKYMNGHSDIVAGSVAGSAERVRRIKHLLDHLGGSLDAHACFLLHRGLKTLALRVRHQSDSALQIARFLAEHPAVERVNYPGLPDHPRHDAARELFAGFGGMLSFELKGGLAAAERLLERVSIPLVAPSLGGVESLLIRPAAAVHVALSPEERAKSGISDGLVRFSVGVESPDDLIADLERALGQG